MSVSDIGIQGAWSQILRHGVRRIVRMELSDLVMRCRGKVLPLLWGGTQSGRGLRVGARVSVFCRNLYFGNDVVIGSDVAFGGTGSIKLGHGVVINRRCTVESNVEVTIGDYTLVGPDCYIVDSNHVKAGPDRPLVSAEITSKPVSIGKHVWLGTRVTVLSGVKIQDYAVVGAGAVVTHDVPSGATVVGVPARQTRDTDSPRAEAHDRGC